MTPQDFRTIRQQAGMSFTQCADYLQNTTRSVRRYEDGTRPIPGPVSRLMKMLDELHTPGKTWKGVE